jgi:hypothetical protein
MNNAFRIALLVATALPLLAQTYPVPGSPNITAITDAATGSPGPFAPGEIVTLWGTNLGPKVPVTQQPVNGFYNTGPLGGTYVFTNGDPSADPRAPYPLNNNAKLAVILYASSTQVNVIIPYGVLNGIPNIFLTLQPPTQTKYGINFGPLWAAFYADCYPSYCPLFVDSAPHIFSTPNGMAEAVNQNGSINTANKPAHRGDIISLFATGEGQTTPAGVDGKLATVPLPRPKLPVTVTIGGQPVQVLYAGGAPGEVAGLMQVNVQIPPLMSFASSTPIPGASVSGGTVYAVPVVLTVGTGDYATSPTATIAVQ